MIDPKPQKTIIHYSNERNLRAAKDALKVYRHSRLMRHEGIRDDIIDVIVDRTIMERHIFRNRELTQEPQARK